MKAAAGQARAEADQLQSALTNWAAAVAARDEQLQRATERLRAAVEVRNDTVIRFNELAGRYNRQYAASWSTHGAWVDVSNNVGKTNAAFPPFEAVPFAGSSLHTNAGQTGTPSSPDLATRFNATEYQAGTDPLDGQDRLSLSYATTSPTAGLALSWRPQASRSYTVETTEDWQTWQPATAPALLYPEPGWVECTDRSTLTNAPTPNRFYRVNVKQP